MPGKDEVKVSDKMKKQMNKEAKRVDSARESVKENQAPRKSFVQQMKQRVSWPPKNKGASL